MTDTELLDAFERIKDGVYWCDQEYRGRDTSGWAQPCLFGPEGPQTWPTIREAMLAMIEEHRQRALYEAKETARAALMNLGRHGLE